MPVATVTPSWRRVSQKTSYSALASSGGAAAMKLGRRPPRASPYRVNCDTTRAEPFTSRRDRFILSFSSSKMRRLAAFSASDAATAAVSSLPTPRRIIKPCEISPETAELTVTLARLTRWMTARMRFAVCRVFYEIPALPDQVGASQRGQLQGSNAALKLSGLRCSRFHRFARQHFGKLGNVVSVNRQDLRTLGEVVPLYAIQGVILRVVILFVVGNFLDAPGCGHSFGVERNVIAPAFAAQAGIGKTDG